MNGKWEITGAREVFDDGYMKLDVANVELPDGKKIEHAVLSGPGGRGFASVLAHDTNRGVLMIWRHRFVTDRWGWELPAGGIDEKESPEQAARRELLEETGWAAKTLRPLISFQPLPGMADREAHVFHTSDATFERQQQDVNEVNDLAWLEADAIEQLITKGDISDGCTLVALGRAQKLGLLA